MKTAGIAAALMLLCASAAGIWAQGRSGETAGSGFLEAVWPGVSRSETEVTLSSKLDENIVRVAVEEGQLVKKGDVLIEFDARLLDERIAIAEIETDFPVVQKQMVVTGQQGVPSFPVRQSHVPEVVHNQGGRIFR